jgi:putative flippase GtrA
MSRPILEILRYVINGIVATAVHYAVLIFNLEQLSMASAGLANMVAALFGISTSFIGSRYFVFRKTDEGILPQAAKFGGLYVAFAVVHGAVLFIWTDWLGYDYRLGFILATVFQMAGSYLGNKFLVFQL